MKVLIVNNMVPYVRGGAELLAEQLERRLNQQPGVDCEVLRVPFTWEPYERLPEQMLLCRSMEIENVDRVIALKFPAYLIPHHNKTLWLIHQYRQAYDLYEIGETNLPATPRGDTVRAQIMAADNACFAACERIFVSSSVIAERLKRFNGFDSEIMNSPLLEPERFFAEGYGDYLFAGGRINVHKRQHLLVEAMAHVRSDLRLVVAGPPDAPADAERLESLVRSHGLADRVTLDLGFHPLAKIADYNNRAAAVAYLPVDEDSLGYVSMEACAAAKAVLTTADSGGILQLVTDGETGAVTAPEPNALAAAVDALFSDRPRLERMGRAAKDHWESKKINWPNTIARLLS